MPDKTKAPDDEQLLSVLKDHLERDNINPERIGCPDPEALRTLALDPKRADADLNLHLTVCSSCFRTFAAVLESVRQAVK